MRLDRIGRAELLKAGIFFALLACLILGWKWRELGTLSEVPLVDPAGVLQVRCWQDFNASQWARGYFPLWNPHTGMGQPHLANIQTAVFYPGSLLYALYASSWFYDLILAGRLFLAAMLLYWFLRRWWLGWPGAAAAAIIYAFGGYGTWFIQLIDVNSQIFLPLLMHLWGKMVLQRTGRDMVLAGLAGAVIITGGHPEAAFNTFAVAGLFVLFLIAAGRGRGKVVRVMASVAASACLAIFLAAASLMPFINYLSHTFSLHAAGFGFFHLDIRGLINLLFPGIHHIFSDLPSRIPLGMLDQGISGMLWAGYAETAVPGVPPGAGALVIFLACVGIIFIRRFPAACFFAGLLVVLLGLTFGLPGFRLLALIPPLNVASNFKFYFSEIHFCIAVLAGFGLERLVSRQSRGILFFICGTLGALLLAWLQFRLAPGACHGPCFALSLEMFRYDALWLSLAIIFLTLSLRRHSLKMLSSCAVLLVISGSLFIHSRMVGPYVNLGSKDLSQAPYISYLVGRAGLGPPFRITGLDGFFPPNLAVRFGLDEISSSDALFLRSYVELLNALNRHTEREGIDYFYPSYYTRPSPEHLDEGLAALLGIRYAVGRTPVDAELIIEDALLKAGLIIAESPPQKMLDTSGPEVRQILFMHAPARLDYRVRASQGETLEFSPWLDEGSRDCYNADGVHFQAMVRSGHVIRLLYSRFFADESAPLDVGRIAYPLSSFCRTAGAELSLVTLPGPEDNRVCDWSGWRGLALRRHGARAQEFKVIESQDQNGETVYISQNPSAFPRAFSPSRSRVIRDKQGRLDILSGLSPERLSAIIILGDDAGREGFPHDRGSISLLHRVAEEVRLDVRRASPGYLVLTEAYYPGWRAWLNGEEVRIIRAYHALRSVVIPRGRHQVIFRFQPVDFRIGLWASLVSLAVGIVFIGRQAFRKGMKGQG